MEPYTEFTFSVANVTEKQKEDLVWIVSEAIVTYAEVSGADILPMGQATYVMTTDFDEE